ncbi:hypothetical protein O181_034003 [Austropuccinia psidii MF-1]|uniref:Uncharacterized protein n=1 Tax=Austropuccinia psidii MF-1 TaxID=1389203 RepID=A0A9Q3H6Y5_9BASI|nr:hypothetical protein [Austropuccinia psidii MF-1]
MLEMQEELIALIKKEGKNKSSSYTPQNSPIEEQTTLPRSFRQHRSLSPYPRPMATSTPYTEQRHSTLPRHSITSRNSKKYYPNSENQSKGL